MDLVQIRHFLTLARTLNFTRAAELCNITQPAFTRSIQRLEEELGGPLVLRERALTQLTQLGRDMLPLLQSTHDAAEAVRARAADHQRAEDAAPLRLGLAPSIPVETLFPVLREVAGRVAGFEMTLKRDVAPALADALLHGSLDIAVLPEGAPVSERLNTWPLWLEQVVVIAPEGHRFAGLERVRAILLDREVVIEADPPGSCSEATSRLASEFGLHLTAIHRGNEAEVAALVALGLGVALVPASACLPPGVAKRPLVEPELTHRVMLGAVAGRPMNRSGAAFLKLSRARSWAAAGG